MAGIPQKRRRTSGVARLRRSLLFEHLESRRLLASDWQNPFDVLDVNDDGIRSSLDVLECIVDIQNNGLGPLPDPPTGSESPPPFVDTNGNGERSPEDILRIIVGLDFPQTSSFTADADREPLYDAPVDPDDVGGSVFLHNGAAHLARTDLLIPARGMDWHFTRIYRSDVSFDGPLGHNWDHNYNRRLWLVNAQTIAEVQLTFPNAQDGDVIVLNGGNRSDVYTRNPDGSFTSPPGYFTQLTDNGDGTYNERSPDGRVVVYETLFTDNFVRMTSISDRNDNTMTFDYHNGRFLTHVVDPLGRSIDYLYSEGHISDVRDFTGRTVHFEYDARGDLISATSPTVTGTPNGNDFPDGKTEQYTYSSGFADSSLNHDLLTVTAPNEFASGGPPREIYGYDTDSASPNFGRVHTQTIGGANSSDVPAGGTITYDYEVLVPDPDPGDLVTPVARTTATDRNSNITEYEFNQKNNILSTKEFTNRDVRAHDPEYYGSHYGWNGDYQLLWLGHPEGNGVEYIYDLANPARLQQGNLLEEIRYTDPNRSGDQDVLISTWTHEPLYNRMRTATDPRGNDAAYVPQNGGVNSPQRYTTVSTFDYQEGTDYAGLADQLGITPAEVQQKLDSVGVPMGLGDVNGDGVTNQIAGNVIAIASPSANLLPGSNQALVEGDTNQEIVRFYTYDDFGQITSTTDPEGNVNVREYYPEADPDGDGILTPPPADGRVLDGTTGGYLRETRRDVVADPSRNSGHNPTPTDIRTQFEYDVVGNITRVIDGRGIATDYDVNELNQVVQITRAAAHDAFAPDPVEPLPLTDFQYVERAFHDYNDNVVLRQVEDRGNTSNVDGNLPAADLPATAPDPDPVGGTAFVDTAFKYDILDNRIEMLEEVANGMAAEMLRTRHRYDANENSVLTILPEGNATRAVYDERDLLFRRERGAYEPPPFVLLGPDDPTDYDVRGGLSGVSVTYQYDLNGNVIETSDPSDTDLSAANNSKLDGYGDRTRYVYDGFDRQTSVIDAVGNQTVFQYDPTGNIVRTTRFGPVGGASPISDGPDILPGPVSVGGVIQTANLVNSNLLEGTEALHDELNRTFQTDRVLFVNTIPTVRPPDVADGAADIGKGNLTPGDNQAIPGVAGVTIIGRVSSRTEYDRNSRTTFKVEDDEDTYEHRYDGADRTIETIDPAGNRVETVYDDNHNVIETRETDVAQVPGVADEVFLTTYFYDSLDRLQQTTDNIGQTMFYRYDSRDNLVAMADAQGPVTGDSITRRAFPDGPLTVNTINDFGNVTRYFYDGLGRQTRQEVILTEPPDQGSGTASGDGMHVGASIFGVKDDASAPESFTPTPDANQGGGDGIIRTGYTHDRNSLQSALIDDSGNVTLYLYDDFNRRVTETKGLVVTSPFTEQFILGDRRVVTPTAATINDPAFIPESRIQAQMDAAAGRISAIAGLFPPLADDVADPPPPPQATTIVYGYDPDGNVLILEDENDSEVFTRYDGINRSVAVRVFRSEGNPATRPPDSHVGDPIFAPEPLDDFHGTPRGPFPAIIGTNVQDFQYDGLSRLVHATDNNGPIDAIDDSVVTYAYDSLSRTIEETQQVGIWPAKAISSGWRADGLRNSLVYPNDRVLEYTYDSLDRLQTIADAGGALPIADYDYIGTSRVLVRAYPENGTRMTYLCDAGTTDIGYDGLRRPVVLRHLRFDNSLIVGSTHSYDRAGNMLTEDKLHDQTNSEIYQYDSAHRLVRFDRPHAGAIDPLHSDWTLDGVGNWDRIDGQDRAISSFNEVLSENGTTFRYDDNGSQTINESNRLRFEWDCQTRLRRVTRDADSAVIAVYSYDAADRRIGKIVINGGIDNDPGLNGTTYFYYDVSRGIEERDAGDLTTQQYVIRAGVDAPLVMDMDQNQDGDAIGPLDMRLFYEQNALFNVFALTCRGASIKEGYQHEAYGQQTVFTPGANGSVDFGGDDVVEQGGASELDNPLVNLRFRLDAETGLHHSGSWYRDPELGRSISRDSTYDTIDGVINRFQYPDDFLDELEQQCDMLLSTYDSWAIPAVLPPASWTFDPSWAADLFGSSPLTRIEIPRLEDIAFSRPTSPTQYVAAPVGSPGIVIHIGPYCDGPGGDYRIPISLTDPTARYPSHPRQPETRRDFTVTPEFDDFPWEDIPYAPSKPYTGVRTLAKDWEYYLSEFEPSLSDIEILANGDVATTARTGHGPYTGFGTN